MINGVKNLSAAKVRDIRIMARQGKSWAYILDVIGCSASILHGTCALHGIVIAGAPPAPAELRERSLPARSATLGLITTAALAAEVKAQAARRKITSGLLLHRIVAAIAARDLWDGLLDSDSVPVASASNPEDETQG